MSAHILAIDQGTTSSRAMVFDADRSIVSMAQRELPQIYTAAGWVEHDPEELWNAVIDVARRAIAEAHLVAADIAAIGIANQRETALVWERATGKPVYNAIVWQDRRTSEACELLKRQGHKPRFTDRTGLILDPYFSGTKVAWILDHVDGSRARAERGELCFGTIDSFLIWRLTGGRSHLTDATNASRTLMFNIGSQDWDNELLDVLRVPRALLPQVRDCAGDFGSTEAAILGASIPIRGVAGDQHAALIGQSCLSPGMAKATYGTGCFILLNTGTTRVHSTHRLLSTVAYRLDGVTTYALEGSVFIAGAAVQWLRDELGIIGSAREAGEFAARADPGHHVYLVPAFVGLGAPWWSPDARGAMFGLVRDSGPAEIARATLESVAFQTHDLLEALRSDCGSPEADLELRVDGGLSESDWAMQAVADLADVHLTRPRSLESTALGAASLAGYAAGVWQSIGAPDSGGARPFDPSMTAATRELRLSAWQRAVQATRSFAG